MPVQVQAQVPAFQWLHKLITVSIEQNNGESGMTESKVVSRCCMAGGLLILISMFSHLVSLVNSYDTYTESNTHVISAFNG